MEYLIAALALAVACAVWVAAQQMSGQRPRACRGDGSCEARGLRSCREGGGQCALAHSEDPSSVPAERINRR